MYSLILVTISVTQASAATAEPTLSRIRTTRGRDRAAQEGKKACGFLIRHQERCCLELWACSS